MPTEHETPANAIKSFISTVSPFITFAFGLIAFIYTREMSQTQAVFVEMKEKMEKRDDAATATAQAVIVQDGRLGRLERDGDRREARITELERRETDLEKTVILSNATRR